MPEVHALLSASSSKQWLNCPPSARLQENFPNESSVYAEEGTFAHSICEYKVKKYLHERVRRPQSEEFYTEELEQSTDAYYEFVVGVIEEMKRNGCEPLVLVEERVDYSHIAPSGFGTADMLIIGHDAEGRGILHICDYKHGKGLFVDAHHNSQMMLYAIGALHAYGYIYPIEIVRMTIIQPRLDNISTYECSREELEAWGESIKPTAKAAHTALLVRCLFQHRERLLDHRVDLRHILFHVALRDLEERPLRLLHQVVHIHRLVERLVLDGRREANQLTSQVFLGDNAGMKLQVRRTGHLTGQL